MDDSEQGITLLLPRNKLRKGCPTFTPKRIVENDGILVQRLMRNIFTQFSFKKCRVFVQLYKLYITFQKINAILLQSIKSSVSACVTNYPHL